METKFDWMSFTWSLATLVVLTASMWVFQGYVESIQRNQIEQAKVIANKLNSLEREIKQMKKTMETKPLILPDVRRTDDEAEVRR